MMLINSSTKKKTEGSIKRFVLNFVFCLIGTFLCFYFKDMTFFPIPLVLIHDVKLLFLYLGSIFEF